MATKLSKGERADLVAAIARWIAGYVALPDVRVATVLALWAIHTWIYSRFDVTPYLAVTSATKGAGKSRVLEVLRLLSKNAWGTVGITPAALFRLVDESEAVTLMMDEAEELGREGQTPLSALANVGYRAGAKVPRVVGGQTKMFNTFCPKAFALIGDPRGTLRDRCIVIDLVRAIPEREFYISEAEGEAYAFTEAIRGVSEWAGEIEIQAPMGMVGREREVWTAIFSVAAYCGIDLEALTAVAMDLSAAKTAEKRSYVDLAGGDSEREAQDRIYAVRLLADVRRVLKESDTRGVFTADLVVRLRALNDAPWRTYRGKGIDQHSLTGLLKRFGLVSRQVRNGKAGGNLGAKGYAAAAIKAAAEAQAEAIKAAGFGAAQ